MTPPTHLLVRSLPEERHAAPNAWSWVAAASIGVALLGAAHAGDRPLPPAEVTVKAISPTAVTLRFLKPERSVDIEIEQTVNGKRVDQATETAMSQRHEFEDAPFYRIFNKAINGLAPRTRYCFRVYTRDFISDMRSAAPSPWGCAVTPPYLPHPPLDVAAALGGNTDITPRLTWNTPDQAGDRPVDRYVVERQSPVGPGRPWIVDRIVAGPRGEQTAATRLAFAVEVAAIKNADKHAYRVCSENAGGRSCSDAAVVSTSAYRELQGRHSTPSAVAAQAPSVRARPQPNALIQGSTDRSRDVGAATSTVLLPAAPPTQHHAASAPKTTSSSTTARASEPAQANRWSGPAQPPAAAPRTPMTQAPSMSTSLPPSRTQPPASALAR